MKNKLLGVSAILLAGLIFIGLLPLNTASASGEIPIDKAHFPDANFRDFVLNGHDDYTGVRIDRNRNGSLSGAELSAVKSIGVSCMNISDLTGIEYFTSLKKLDCSSNGLTALDISRNTALTRLGCSINRLTGLDVSSNTALTELYCFKNQLKNLDVSRNTALKILACPENLLTELDVSRNTALESIDCSNNLLTDMDISKNTALKQFHCIENLLTELDVSKNTALTQLSCGGNALTNLDVSRNTALTDLYCYENRLTNLDVSQNTALMTLYCNNNRLTGLDVSRNTDLRGLCCLGNRLTGLDVSRNVKMDLLWCGTNCLTSLDVSRNTELIDFDCTGNSYRIPSSPYDLKNLPEGFEISKASDWERGTVKGNILTFDDENISVSYMYNCGSHWDMETSLYIADALFGDYDCSKTVDETDAELTIRSALKLIFPSGQSLSNADIDGSGILTAADALLIMRIYTGISRLY